MDTYTRAYASGKPGRNSQPSSKSDIVSSNALKSCEFMGNWTDEQIAASIRRTREENREIKFKKPTNFGG